MEFTGAIVWISVLLLLLWLVVLFTSIRSLVNRTDIGLGLKIFWAIIISLAPVLGLIAYVVIGRKPRKGMKV
jgi:hypothetical protein